MKKHLVKSHTITLTDRNSRALKISVKTGSGRVLIEKCIQEMGRDGLKFINWENACNVTFYKCDLSGLDFSGGYFADVKFIECDLSHSNFSHANFAGKTIIDSSCTTDSMDLRGSLFRSVHKSKFRNAYLGGSNIAESYNSIFEGCDFSGAILSRFGLVRCLFDECKLTNCLISGRCWNNDFIDCSINLLKVQDKSHSRLELRNGSFRYTDPDKFDLNYLSSPDKNLYIPTIKNLNKMVLDQVRGQADCFNMDDWYKHDASNCKTKMCWAGWILQIALDVDEKFRNDFGSVREITSARITIEPSFLAFLIMLKSDALIGGQMPDFFSDNKTAMHSIEKHFKASLHKNERKV